MSDLTQNNEKVAAVPFNETVVYWSGKGIDPFILNVSTRLR